MKRGLVAVGLTVLILVPLGVLGGAQALVDVAIDGPEEVGPDERVTIDASAFEAA